MIHVLRSPYSEKLFYGFEHRIKWFDEAMLLTRHHNIEMIIADDVYGPIDINILSQIRKLNHILLTKNQCNTCHDVTVYQRKEVLLNLIFGELSSHYLWILASQSKEINTIANLKALLINNRHHHELNSLLVVFDPYSNILDNIECRDLLSCYQSIYADCSDSDTFRHLFIRYHAQLDIEVLTVKLTIKEYLDLDEKTVKIILSFLKKYFSLHIICFDIRNPIELTLCSWVDHIYTYTGNICAVKRLIHKEVSDFESL